MKSNKQQAPVATSRPRPTASQPTPGPAMDWKTPLRLALLNAIAVLAWFISTALVIVAGWQWHETGQSMWALFAIPAIVFVVFGLALWHYTDQVAWSVWVIEEATGQDLDGDGIIGQPPQYRDIPLTANGERQQPIILEGPQHEKPEPPPPVFVRGLGMTPDDVVAFLNEAQKVRGLSRSKWIGAPKRQRWAFPSGKAITRGDYDKILEFGTERNWWTTTNGRPTEWIVKAPELAEIKATIGRIM